MPLAAEVFTPEDQTDPGEHTDGYPAACADPVVIEGIFQKIGNAKQHGDNADAIEPYLADSAFEVRPVFRRFRSESRERRGRHCNRGHGRADGRRRWRRGRLRLRLRLRLRSARGDAGLLLQTIDAPGERGNLGLKLC